MMKEFGRDTRFLSKDGLHVRSWFKNISKKYLTIKQKNAKSVSKARVPVTQDRLKKVGTKDIIYRIFNGHESGLKLRPKIGKVLGLVNNNEDFYKYGTFREKTNYCNADCRCIPPVLIFRHKNVQKSL